MSPLGLGAEVPERGGQYVLLAVPELCLEPTLDLGLGLGDEHADVEELAAFGPTSNMSCTQLPL